jgi:hypothetical protein
MATDANQPADLSPLKSWALPPGGRTQATPQVVHPRRSLQRSESRVGGGLIQCLGACCA